MVPGHDSESWGAQYGKVKEADMNLSLATKVFLALKKDKRFEVHITRNSKGYTKEFENYFLNHKEEIIAFKSKAQTEFKARVEKGTFVEKENTPHNKASADVALKLYGINKWANDNKMDAVIHVHFNDVARKNVYDTGPYKGFVVYVPEEQMANAKESIILGKSLLKELKKKYDTSTYEKELGGLTPDQKLIALGSHGTLYPSVRSVLVEYGYIYRFKTKNSRETAYKHMSSLTTTAIKNYFFPKTKK